MGTGGSDEPRQARRYLKALARISATRTDASIRVTALLRIG